MARLSQDSATLNPAPSPEAFFGYSTVRALLKAHENELLSLCPSCEGSGSITDDDSGMVVPCGQCEWLRKLFGSEIDSTSARPEDAGEGFPI